MEKMSVDADGIPVISALQALVVTMMPHSLVVSTYAELMARLAETIVMLQAFEDRLETDPLHESLRANIAGVLQDIRLMSRKGRGLIKARQS